MADPIARDILKKLDDLEVKIGMKEFKDSVRSTVDSLKLKIMFTSADNEEKIYQVPDFDDIFKKTLKSVISDITRVHIKSVKIVREVNDTLDKLNCALDILESNLDSETDVIPDHFKKVLGGEDLFKDVHLPDCDCFEERRAEDEFQNRYSDEGLIIQCPVTKCPDVHYLECGGAEEKSADVLDQVTKRILKNN